jgi:hypothetical protein
MARKDPLRASGAHISIIGHITAEELLRRLRVPAYAGAGVVGV